MVRDLVRYYKVRNWEKYQSYPGRKMSWFKFHGGELCNDDAFFSLDETARLQLMSCWTIASENANEIPDRGRFAERYNLSDAPFDLNKLVEAGFLECIEETAAIAGTFQVAAKCEPSERQVIVNLRSRLDKSREEKSREESTSVDNSTADIEEVYDHWRRVCHKTDKRFAKISPARRRKIVSRLKEFSAAELRRALDGVAADPWPERKQHNDIVKVFGSQESVDRFLEMAQVSSGPVYKPLTEQA